MSAIIGKENITGAFIMEIKRCPNCSGKLELSTSRKMMTCPFCGSEFTVDEETRSAISEGFAEKDWFIYDWDFQKTKANRELDQSVTAFLRAINEFGTAAKIEEYMRNYLMKYDEVSAPGLREDKMIGIKSRIAGTIKPEERIILYDDDGLFTHGKTGTVITDKRTLLIEKKKITNISHSAIPYLLFEYSVGLPGVKLGERYANNIGIFNSHFDLQGTAAALICALSFEENPARPKIRLVT